MQFTIMSARQTCVWQVSLSQPSEIRRCLIAVALQ